MANTSTTPKGQEQNRNNPTLEKAKEAGFQAMDKAKDVAKDASSKVGDMVNQAASAVGKGAENLTSSAGSSLRHLGDTIREHTPQEGVLGSASQTVANTLRDSGRYIEEAGFNGMAKDVTELVRRNPIPAICIGLGLGFLLGRMMRS